MSLNEKLIFLITARTPYEKQTEKQRKKNKEKKKQNKYGKLTRT